MYFFVQSRFVSSALKQSLTISGAKLLAHLRKLELEKPVCKFSCAVKEKARLMADIILPEVKTKSPDGRHSITVLADSSSIMYFSFVTFGSMAVGFCEFSRSNYLGKLQYILSCM